MNKIYLIFKYRNRKPLVVEPQQAAKHLTVAHLLPRNGMGETTGRAKAGKFVWWDKESLIGFKKKKKTK